MTIYNILHACSLKVPFSTLILIFSVYLENTQNYLFLFQKK